MWKIKKDGKEESGAGLERICQEEDKKNDVLVDAAESSEEIGNWWRSRNFR